MAKNNQHQHAWERFSIPNLLNKISLFLTLCFLSVNVLFASVSYAQTTVLSLHITNKPVAEVLDEIEQQSEFRFYYNGKLIDMQRKVSVNAKDADVFNVLNQIFAASDIEYKIVNKDIILSGKDVKSTVTRVGQQQMTISGVVTDNTGFTVPGVNVVIKDTRRGVVTDENGRYSIDVPDKDVTLVFSFIGYATKEVVVGNQTIINVVLGEDSREIEEVVVVGYGTMTRKEITGSVTNVTAKDFNQGLQKSAADMLQGKVAGLQINNGSGDVTSNATIRLRGVTTLLNDQGPFFVIDNIPGADLSTVSPQDIESISVLKDASAAAIYGSRAAGGVILVTTKKGVASKPTVNYTGAVGISTLANKPDLFTANEWRHYVTEKGYDSSLYDHGGNTDWFDEITRTGIQQDHSLSVAGGGTNNNYRGSISYMKRDGLARDNWLDRYNIRLQFSQFALNNRLKIDLTAVSTMSNTQPTYGRNFLLAYNMSPVRPVKNADGTWHESYDYDQGNPVRNQKENSREYETLNAYVTAAATLTIIDGLDTKLFVAKSRNSSDYSEYNGKNSEAGISNGGFAKRSSDVRNKELLEWTNTYNKQFGNHKLNVLAGYSWEEESVSSHFAQNRTFISNYLGANDLASGEGYRKGDIGSAKEESRLISFYGRVNYSYMGKYNLTATLREDGSSKFGDNHKWGTFPSVSAAWNISEEGFLSDASFLSDLKLSAGWGIMGNQTGLSPYNSLGLYGYGGTYYDNGTWHTGYSISQNPNPDLRWEQTSMLNIGVDFGVFNNRLSGRFEWYNKKTSDMLYEYSVPTPPYMYGTMMANVGDMKNTGIELTLNATPIITSDFSWNISLNLAHNKNEVTKLSNDIYTTERQLVGSIWWRGGGTTTHILEVGKPVGQFYGLQCAGLENGDYKIIDQDGEEGISEPADYTYIGNAQPSLTYGINNSFQYKNFDFSFFLRGVYGNDVLNLPRLVYAQGGFMPGANALNDPLTWELKVTPKYSDYYLEKGSYLRLDNMTLGYTFPKLLNGVRIYATGQNLFVITGYSGLDPELPISTGEGLAPGVEPLDFYPKARSFSFGLSVNF
ncbi:TonB-linked SusC/RagA family outer membrane protein [Parabacteroides sp. PF5-5]|uniref:TonB-dependent receptor n=1 Tax=unclassified Parabacteroides TaxID=2649774 RepID=UPI0024739EBE|nr:MULTISPECIES: TonB-dependent receptor [unclassified Parabacteroides]MDH6305708.1 TonB-linked SusC/RagA family outer membrane protein [Parabacteroides sp. PH5-39]MDH6316780.1 TonB-linked SusC/RagA family outer membrane protein [Parabacteroides sp. PF5-13]MDH6320421.1 TonB-linked SusC/RagA family outer membrane protein [Parabacteroides sp. PH5-13]MDH6324151.1 TonB-linked SusC/RagA family outer membrane protein [Parabacteroides sp. PH5-8]MDH6327966.1 TonB-linked SusC/RagA family outer membrane